MSNNIVEKVRGTTDLLPSACEFNDRIRSELVECIKSFGFRPIDVPVLEHTELYLKKSGPDIISRLYDFSFQNRRLALRPEMTATVHIALETREGVLALPRRAVRREDGQAFVLVHGERRGIATGARDGEWCEIVDGLAEGDEVRLGEEEP